MAEAEESVNQEVKKDEDLESLKETAKEKLAEAAINGSGDNNGKMNGHDGNGNTSKEDTTAENTEDEEVLETAEDEEDEIADGEEDEDDEEEDEDDEDDEEEEVQEVKDDDSSDSDIMEVEAEDPLKAKPSMTATEVKKPQVVTIDDPKALQALATSAAKSKANKEKDKVTIIDTSAILAGRSTSGVTITPAASSSSTKNLPSSLASSLAASGVTISSKSIPASSSSSPSSAATPSSEKTTPVPGSNFVYDSKGQLQDPNLTDDTIVIEAPSFIVPYVYEKPPAETFQDFKEAIKKLMAEIKAKVQEETKEEESEEKEKKKKKKKKKKNGAKKKAKKGDDQGSGEEDNGDLDEDDDDYEGEDDSEEDSDDSDIVEVAKSRASSPDLPDLKKPNSNFFESTLGKFVSDLGMNLVQEAVQVDLLRQQQRKAKKDKSAAVMHAIISLKQNIEQSKENNSQFHFEEKKCKFCSFRTESDLALQHHLETPHMRHGLYRCNFCHYETKSPQEVMGHMQGFHEVKARLERAPGLHQCPQCPFEDMMKGKLTRHKVGCDKRFRAERNQEPPHDWEPPAKIPKPPQYHNNTARAAGVSVLNAQGRLVNVNQGVVRGALQQFNQQKSNLYSGMPALQFGPGRGRPPSKPFMANRQVQRGMNLPTYGQVSRLAGNPSVTIQSISKTGGFKSNNPSISITPVSGNRPGGATGGGFKPGAPAGGSGKDNLVICEICDGYIRDLEQLRNHMQFIHKVKIHPKMIHNRPPLNCQKCQYRFFTDQGLERHLLGSHGLVTASMQELANKGQDSGRCPVCGKMFHWKLLNHVAKDHMKTLKPAHLSYKCTVCTATFGQYKLFENHVYSAHSGGRKSAGAPSKPAGRPPTIGGRPLKVSDEITIIPQGKATQVAKKTMTSQPPPKRKPVAEALPDPDVIEIDDEEEEIDDVEEDGDKKKNGKSSPTKRKAAEANDDEEAKSSSKNAKTSATSSEANSDAAEDSGEEGIEEIKDDDEVDDD